MRKFDLSLRSSRSSYFATFRHQLTILSKTDALDEEKWLNMLGTFVKDWFRYESHFVHGRDSLVDILKERSQYFTNDQIKEMTRKVSAEVDLVHQQTQNQRYGSSHIGATAKDISNVVTDAASGVVDIFHGIDKAVADTWNNFWKDGKADGIGSNLSRK